MLLDFVQIKDIHFLCLSEKQVGESIQMNDLTHPNSCNNFLLVDGVEYAKGGF